MNQSGSNFWLLMAALARRKGFIIAFVAIATVISIVVSLLLPKWYRATAMVLPGEGDQVTLSRYALPGETPPIAGLVALPNIVTPADVYARILRSRAVTKPIIERFELSSRYKTESLTDTYLALMSHADFRVTEEGLLTVSVEDRQPDTAAAIANAFVDELNRIIGDLVTGRARLRRQFLQERVVQVKAALDSARSALAAFQRKNKTIDFTQQTRLAIEQAILLKTRMDSLDVELELNRRLLGEDHPFLAEIERQRRALADQLQRLETGDRDTSYFSVPLAAMPRLQGEYENLYSRVKATESLYQLLLEQLEQAKVQESAQTPAISVLDRAVPPEIRSRPQRTLIVGVTFILSLMVSVLLALLFDYVERLSVRSDEETQQALFVIESFLGWLPGIRRRRAAKEGGRDG